MQTRPELSRLILDKLSKVKGKKVRKSVVEAARGMLEACAFGAGVVKEVERCRFGVMMAQWS